jgi:site-specific DNA-methyltransferase (adenine-specific)
MIKLILGDCLIESDKIDSGSVDLILTDLPYGTMTKLNYKEQVQCRGLDSFKWDEVIETNRVMQIANRVLRKNGKMVLFSQQPFTNEIINGAIPNVPFSYSMIWEKDNYGHALLAKKSPLNYYEDVLVFSKELCYTGKNPLKKIMEDYFIKYGKDYLINLVFKEGRYKTVDSAKAITSYKFGFNKGRRFELMDLKMYNYLSYFIDFKETYQELKEIDSQFKKKFSSTFNLWEGNKYKSNILKYKKDYTGHHPTQKPILLLEDLIKTFSNENDLVVDLTMGSGSTLVACKNTNRNGIGIELNDEYYEIANKRIAM